MTRLAVGLVHRPAGTPAVDRNWARALVVRHARDRGLRLLDILELDDDAARTAHVLRRVANLAASAGAHTLVTEGVDIGVAGRAAQDLGLAHEAVPPSVRAAEL